MTSRTLPTDGWLDLDRGWLFASIRDAVVVVDAESARIVLWNPAASDLFGYSAEEALDLSLGDLVVGEVTERQVERLLFGYSAEEALDLSLGDLADDVLEPP